MRARFAKDYLVVMIDESRMTGGAALGRELRKGRRGGQPWMVILAPDGAERITSNDENGKNCGCPVDPHEVDHFLAMVDATRRHMSEDDRVVLGRELRDFAAGFLNRRTRTPGQTEYAGALQGVKTGQFEAAVAGLAAAVAKGYPAERLTRDASLRPLREDPDRRPALFALLKKHVAVHHIRMVDPNEAGRRIRLVGRVVDMKTGEPLAGALMQLFHTDAGGEYRPGMDAGGGAGNPRLFGYLRTDAQGGFVVDTIMPERYPNSSVPRHVHYHVWADGYPKLVSECFFDADPLLREDTRRSAPKRNFPIVKLTRDESHRAVGKLTVRVPRK